MAAATQKVLLRRTLEHRAEQLERRLERGEPGARARLRAIREAESRLSSDVFGFCEVCCLQIPWGQLLAEPERRRCKRCAEAEVALTG